MYALSICFCSRASLENSITCDLNLFSWSSTVNEIMQHDDLLVARQPACRHCSRALLEGQLLVIPVDCLLHIHLHHNSLFSSGRHISQSNSCQMCFQMQAA